MELGLKSLSDNLVHVLGFGGENLNTFTAIVHLSQFNNSCLKSPASSLVDLIFQSRSFSLNQLTCHYRRETCTAASVYLADVIFIPFIVYYAYIVI